MSSTFLCSFGILLEAFGRVSSFNLSFFQDIWRRVEWKYYERWKNMFRFLIVKCCVAPEHKWNTRLNITLRHVTLKETSRRRNFRKIDVDVGLLNEPWRGFPLTKSSLKKSSIKDKIIDKIELKQTWMCFTYQLKERTATTAETTQYPSCISPGLNRVWSVP